MADEPTTPNPTSFASSRVTREITADWMKELPAIAEPAKPEGESEPAAQPAPAAEPKIESATAPAKVEPKAAEPAAAPAKPADEPEEKWPRSSKDWDAYKTKHRERLTAKETEIATLKSQMAELEKKANAVPGANPEFESLKKAHDELSEQLRLVSVENHPKFKQYYKSKIDGQIAQAKRIVGADKAEAIAGLLELPDSQYRSDKIEEMVADLSPLKQAQLGAVLNAVEDVRSERQSEIERAKTDAQKWQEESQRKAQASAVEQRTKIEGLFNQMLGELQDPEKGLAVFQTKTGDDTWNKEVEGRISQAKELLFGKPTVDQMLNIALRGVALAPVLRSHKALFEENQKLQEQVKSLSAAAPKLESHKKADQPEEVPVKKGPFSSREQAAEWVQDLEKTRQAAMAGSGE